jgi:hypothetical protein
MEMTRIWRKSANLRRIVNILTPEVMKEYLKMLYSLFSAIFDLRGSVLRISEGLVPISTDSQDIHRVWLKFLSKKLNPC